MEAICTPSSLQSAAVQELLRNNAANKAAGRVLLAQLPLSERMLARLKSAVAIIIIYSTFWVSVYATALLSIAAWLYCKLVTPGDPSHPPAAQPTLAMEGLPLGGQGRAAPGAHPPGVVQGAGSQSRLVQQQQTAIVTGGKMTKALHLCRHLHAAGWRVVLLETHKYWHVGARLSAAVDVFRTVPVPEEDPQGYFQAITGIAKEFDAGLFVPVSSPIASVYDALAAEVLPAGCRSLTLTPEQTVLLDDKSQFSDFCKSLGLRTSEHHKVASPEEVRALNSPQALGGGGKRFLLKNLSYDSVHRADLFTLPCAPAALESYLGRQDVVITQQQPWMLQEWVEGTEYSCYTIANQGRIVAHADTLASLSNLNYAFQDHNGIWDWVHTFVTRSGVSGQLCFDFIQTAGGTLYCIECNPRTSSVVTEFHDHPFFPQALVSPDPVTSPLKPLRHSPSVHWFWNEVARLAMTGDAATFTNTILKGTDAVFTVSDPLPFLGLHYLQLPMLLLANIWRGNPWTKLDLCIGKIAELYGD